MPPVTGKGVPTPDANRETGRPARPRRPEGAADTPAPPVPLSPAPLVPPSSSDAVSPGARRPSAADEQSLVRRCVNGDETAWEEFLDRAGPVIQGVVRRVLGRYRTAGESDAEDAFAAVIETLLRDNCHTLRSFREPFNLAGWVSVIARRQCRAFIESRQIPERGVEDLESVGGQGGAVMDALAAREGAAHQAQAALAVRDLLDDLAPRDRLMVKLFYFDRKKYREIAAILRMPMANVGKTLARALEKLRAKAEAEGWGME